MSIATADDGPSIADPSDEVAATDGEAVPNSPIRPHCRVPAVSPPFPDVDGKRVLDAACEACVARGTWCRWFGLGASREMIRTARERFGHRATSRVADLTDPPDFLDDEVAEPRFEEYINSPRDCSVELTIRPSLGFRNAAQRPKTTLSALAWLASGSPASTCVPISI